MSSLAASELILNADGSIYHLNLHPEQVGDIIITVGDPDRVALVSRHFDWIEHRVSRREFVTHTGYLGPHRLSVISTGIGTDNVDIVLNELDALVNIDLVDRKVKKEHKRLDFIRIGTTGGLQPELAVGTCLSSAYAAGLDGLLHFYEYDPSTACRVIQQAIRQVGQGLPVAPYVVAADPELMDIITPDWDRGITLTSPGFYAPQGRQLRLPSRLSNESLDRLAQVSYQGLRMTNFEMETAGLLGLAQLLGHRAISCSVILANRPAGTFSKDPGRDTERLIERVLANVADR